MKNIDITPDELAEIRRLPDFDLTMLLSEIHANGWVNPIYPNAMVGGRALLPLILRSVEKEEHE